MINFFPKGKKKSYIIEKVNHNSSFYWPNKFIIENPIEVNHIFNYLNDEIQLQKDTFLDACGKKNLSFYADNVIKIEIDGFSDKCFYSLLEKYKKHPFLFTGGGLLPKNIFNIKDLKLFHIHPGYLPQIRGADGFFWSILIRKKIGLSCFVMNAGLDTGDLLKTMEMPIPKLKLNTIHKKNTKNAYRLIYSFLDPFLRGYLLKKILQKNTNLNNAN